MRRVHRNFSQLYYFDKLVFLSHRFPLADERAKLQDQCHKSVSVRRSRDGVQRAQVTLNQPSHQALRTVAGWLAAKIILVEIAMDVITPDEATAERFREWAIRRLWHQRKPKGTHAWLHRSTYYSVHAAGRRSQWCVYADRPCRWGGQPCLHIELKLTCARAVRSDVADNTKIADTNPAEILRERMRFEEIDDLAFSRAVRNAGLANSPKEVDAEVKRLKHHARLVTNELSDAQALRCWEKRPKWLRPDRVCKLVTPEWDERVTSTKFPSTAI